MLSRSSSRSQPPPEKISLLQEARWLILGVVSLYVGMIPRRLQRVRTQGWSHASDVTRAANPGGRFGAWLADLLLYLFGISSWWWVVSRLQPAVGFPPPQEQARADHRSFPSS